MILEKLRARTLEYRKARHPMAAFLVSVTAKAADFAKKENPQDPVITEDHAVRAIQSFVKGAEDNIKLLAHDTANRLYVLAQEERKLLKEFLPAEATDEEVRAFAVAFVEERGDWMGAKMALMGGIMAELKHKFGASLNSAAASKIVKEVLSE